MKRKKRDKKKDEILDVIMTDERERVLHIVEHKIKAYEHTRVDGMLKRLERAEKVIYELKKELPKIQNTLNAIWDNKIFRDENKNTEKKVWDDRYPPS